MQTNKEKSVIKLGSVVYAYNPSTREVGAGDKMIHQKLKDSLSSVTSARLLKTQPRKQNKTKKEECHGSLRGNVFHKKLPNAAKKSNKMRAEENKTPFPNLMGISSTFSFRQNLGWDKEIIGIKNVCTETSFRKLDSERQKGSWQVDK